MLEIVNLNSDDFSDEMFKLKQLSKGDEEVPLAIKSRVLVSTPGTVQKMIENGFFDEKRRMFNIIADKVELLQALDFTDEMIEIGNFV
jgi:chaperonin GroEL (HSP60 family)